MCKRNLNVSVMLYNKVNALVNLKCIFTALIILLIVNKSTIVHVCSALNKKRQSFLKNIVNAVEQFIVSCLQMKPCKVLLILLFTLCKI